MSISPRGVGVIMLLLIMHEVVLTDCVREPFSATHKAGDTKASVSGTTLVVHKKPSTPSPPSPGPAIIARGTHPSPRRSLNLPSKVKTHHAVLHVGRPPRPSLPTCRPWCK